MSVRIEAGSWLTGRSTTTPAWLPGGKLRMSPTPRSSVMTSRLSSVAACTTASTELLVEDGVHVVAPPGEFAGEVAREVLVELELHAGSGKISSRASAAP